MAAALLLLAVCKVGNSTLQTTVFVNLFNFCIIIALKNWHETKLT